jgi:hypothetical protein
MRVLFNRDISTGLLPLYDGFSTIGPESTWHIKNSIPERPEPSCYILSPETCTAEQYELVKNGSGVVKNYILQSKDDEDLFVDNHRQEVLIEEL